MEFRKAPLSIAMQLGAEHFQIPPVYVVLAFSVFLICFVSWKQAGFVARLAEFLQVCCVNLGDMQMLCTSV